MCGLVGVAGSLVAPEEDTMKRMLLDDYWRGDDATGLAAIRSNGDVQIAKLATHPLTLFDTPKFREALNGFNSCAFLGHNRKRTKGENNDFNAHPFRFGHIVGCHNGTLFSTGQDKLEEALGEKFPVDSMSIFASIAAVGIAETVPLLDGAWALTWVDLKEGSINFLRNKDRPLWYCQTQDDKFIYWASEWPTIHAGMRGEPDNRKLKKDKNGCRYFQFAEDYHFKYDLEAFLKGKSQKPTIAKREGKKWVPLDTKSSNFGNHTRYSPFRKTTSTTHSPSNEDHRHPPAFVTVEGSKDDPYAGQLTEEEFTSMAVCGCAFCERKIEFGTMGITVWKKDGVLLCPEHSSFADKGKARIYVEEIPQPAILA
jgi:predicted glutamine amidotransferase